MISFNADKRLVITLTDGDIDKLKKLVGVSGPHGERLLLEFDTEEEALEIRLFADRIWDEINNRFTFEES